MVGTTYRTVQSTYKMDNIFRVQRFSAELFSEPLGEENKSRKTLNEENMSILFEKPCHKTCCGHGCDSK